MYVYAWCFFIFSFFGWCLEVAYHAIKKGRFVNRGFLSGPICPIYGIGVCLLDLLLGPFNSVILLFLTASLMATALELVIGFIMDKIFECRWWDYSSERWNFHGYVCLKFSLIWGVLCLICAKVIVPVKRLVYLFGHPMSYAALYILISLAFYDLVFSAVRVFKFNHRLELLERISSDASSSLSVGSNFIGNGLYRGTLRLYYEYELVLSLAARLGIRFIDAFPSFRSSRYNEQIRRMKRRLALLEEKSKKR